MSKESKKIFEQAERKIRGLIRTGELPNTYDPIDVALYCFITSAAYDPVKLYSDDLEGIRFSERTKVGAILHGALPDMIENWSEWNENQKAIFKKIQEDEQFLKLLKKYGLLSL